MAVERYPYDAMAAKEANADTSKFVDLSTARGSVEYNPGKQPTNNIRALLYTFYPKDKITAYAHALKIFLALHEQCKALGMKDGFNDLSQQLDERCRSIEIEHGRIRFTGDEGKLIGEFVIVAGADASASAAKERPASAPAGPIVNTGHHDSALEGIKITPLPSAAEVLAERNKRAAEIAARTRAALAMAMPDLEPAALKRPKLAGSRFRLPPDFYKQNGKAPPLLDPKGLEEHVICARWATAFLRQYLGDKVSEFRLEGSDAWHIKQRMLAATVRGAPPGTKAVKVDYSLNNFLEIRGGRIELGITVVYNKGRRVKLHGEKARQSPYYGMFYRRFMKAAAPVKYPPGLITLYFHGTHSNPAIIEANVRDGANSKNSHVVVNLGEGKKSLDTGRFSSSEERKKVGEVVWANFPNAQRKFDWMLLENQKTRASRIFLNGEQLRYQGGEFYRPSGEVASVGQDDKVELHDVFVADKFHRIERINGLTELMMTGRYELVDVLNFNPAAIPEAKRTPPKMPPYGVLEVAYLKAGETLDARLQAAGIPPDKIPLHLYAYEKIGLNVGKLRPFDSVPIFKTEDIQAEVEKAGGLAKALVEARTARAKRYMEKHPGEYVFTIRPDISPSQLAGELLKLAPFAKLGALNGIERQFILTMISAANHGIFLLEVDRKGTVTGAPMYIAGADVYVNDAYLSKITTHIENQRAIAAVYIPEKLPGDPTGQKLRPVTFEQDERAQIERASHDPYVRKALALILAIEQKQEEGLLHRSTGKAIAEFLPVALTEAIDKRPRSLGKFQIRPQQSDVDRFALSRADLQGKPRDEIFEAYRAVLLKNDQQNADLAAHRVSEILVRVDDIYAAHNEPFDPNNEGCMANVLNVYHSSESKVLVNIFTIWASLFESSFGFSVDDSASRAPTTKNTIARFVRIAQALKNQGKIGVNDNDIGDIASLISGNKMEFLRSPLLAQLEKAYEAKTGSRLSLNIPPEVLDRSVGMKKYLHYGILATRYGALKTIENHSLAMRKKGPVDGTLFAQR